MPEIQSAPAGFDLDLGVNAKVEAPILVVDHDCVPTVAAFRLNDKNTIVYDFVCEHGKLTFTMGEVEFREST